MEKEIKKVIDLSADKAKEFFLQNSSYASFQLPAYFTFEPMLHKIHSELAGKLLKDYFNNGKPNDYEGVNYALFTNKDGQHQWRKLELINPVIYVSLIDVITQRDNWKLLQQRWKEFYQTAYTIMPEGMPTVTSNNINSTGAQISHWFEKVEQESIKKAMNYNIITHTDITNCYSQIYTHSIAWAIHGKDYAKRERRNPRLLGNIIDEHIQYMHYGQTNGIPEGSVIMDFIAEYVLGYADFMLFSRLEEQKINGEDYVIIRYRDDYRIFTQDEHQSMLILRELSKVMAELGLRLNNNKTAVSNEIILSSVKNDKITWISKYKPTNNIYEYLLQIYEHSIYYPNSGSVLKALSKIYKLFKNIELKYDPETTISILSNIAARNPRATPEVSGIISIIFQKKIKGGKKQIYLEDIRNRMSKTHNHAFYEIWLQRIAISNDINFISNQPLCIAVQQGGSDLWEMGWTSSDRLKQIVTGTIIDRKVRRKIKREKAIPIDEVSPFNWDS